MMTYPGLEATIVRLWLTAQERISPNIHDHAKRVCRLAVQAAKRHQLSQAAIRLVAQAALVHDIGKVAVPSEVAHKPGKLNSSEWAAMREHTLVGYAMLEPVPVMRSVAVIVRSHHERWDGTGYPDGLIAQSIPLEARIVTVADSLDTMLTPRPYREIRSLEQVVSSLLDESGRQFDPDLIPTAIMLAEIEYERRKKWLH